MNSTSPTRFVLRDLPLAVRLTLSAFLISVGIGYLAALVQLHLQHAAPGNLLPSGKDSIAIFHGSDEKPQSKFEALLVADENRPFNGQGQMSAAFTKKSTGWTKAISRRAKKLNGDETAAETELRKERDGERLALLAWVRAGGDQDAYENDAFPMPADLKDHPITEEYVDNANGVRAFKVKTVITDRCVRCHSGGGGAGAQQFPLETYDQIKPHLEVKESSGAMSLAKLAQSSHVHLLGFAMLYGLTGIIFAFSSFPALVRGLLAPLPLVVQMIDIACWWLARLEAPYGTYFALAIPITGGIVAVGLLLHIVLSLFDLYGKVGKLILVLLLGGVIGGGVALDVKGKICNFLANEKAPAAATE
jgi:hypothetical protein